MQCIHLEQLHSWKSRAFTYNTFCPAPQSAADVSFQCSRAFTRAFRTCTGSSTSTPGRTFSGPGWQSPGTGAQGGMECPSLETSQEAFLYHLLQVTLCDKGVGMDHLQRSLPSTQTSAPSRRPTNGKASPSSKQVWLPNPEHSAQPAPSRAGRSRSALPARPSPGPAPAPPQVRPRPARPGSSGGGAGAMAAAELPLPLLLLRLLLLLLLLPRPPAALRLLLDAAPPFTCSQPVRSAREPGWGGRRRPWGPGGVTVATGLCPRGSVAVPGSAAGSERAVLEAPASARAGCESLLRPDVAQCSKSFNQFFAAEGFSGELSIACTRGF